MAANQYKRSGKRIAPDGTRRRMDEHRLTMEAHLGYRLPRSMHVHHINGDKRDNRIENLEVIPAHIHGAMHAPAIQPIVKNCTVCGAEFRPHKTKRKRAKTCSERCRQIQSSRSQRRPEAPNSIYREDAYPCQVKARYE